MVEEAVWEDVFKAFNESQDDIEARYGALSGNYGSEYLQNFRTRIAANAPDVFFILDGHVAGFVERVMIDPIDDYVASTGLNLDNYFTAHVDGLRYKDQLRGLPRSACRASSPAPDSTAVDASTTSSALSISRVPYWTPPASRRNALYDTENDPYEPDNLIGSPAVRDLCDRLMARIINRMRSAGEPVPTIESVSHDGRLQHLNTETEYSA